MNAQKNTHGPHGPHGPHGGCESHTPHEPSHIPPSLAVSFFILPHPTWRQLHLAISSLLSCGFRKQRALERKLNGCCYVARLLLCIMSLPNTGAAVALLLGPNLLPQSFVDYTTLLFTRGCPQLSPPILHSPWLKDDLDMFWKSSKNLAADPNDRAVFFFGPPIKLALSLPSL